MRTHVEFTTTVKDREGKIWYVVANASCDFEQTKLGVDESFDGPLYRMTDFTVEHLRMSTDFTAESLRMSNGDKFKAERYLADLDDIFETQELDWIESRAVEGLKDALLHMEVL